MKVLKTSMLIIGSIIGAGFASGKEIFTFFAKYGVISLLFVVPLFFLIYLFNYVYLKFGSKFKNFDLKKGNHLLCKNKSFFKITYNPLNVIMFLTFLILSSAMFSALVALLQTYFVGLPKVLCFVISLVVTYILTKGNLKIFSRISNLCVEYFV